MATNPYKSAGKPEKTPAGSVNGEVDKLNTRFNRGLKLRQPWEGLFQECYDYAMPQKEPMFATAPGQTRVDHIYDETAVVAVPEFASRLASGIIPDFAKWSEYRAGSDIPEDQKQEVDAQLESVTEYVFEVIHNSNFAQEANETFLDLAVGTASMSVVDGDESNLINCKAIPLNQLVLDNGPNDRIDLNGRQRKIPISHIKKIWPKARLSGGMSDELRNDPNKMVVIRECVYRDYSSSDERYDYKVFPQKGDDVLFSEKYEGEGSNPYITFRWSKMAGEVWGRGPLLNALPAIKTCNLTVQLILENAEMSIVGAYQGEDDGVLNTDTISIVPGSVVAVAPGSGGLTPLVSGGNFDVAQLILDDMRANIKRALYNEMLGNPDRTPKSATEITERMADLSRQIGASYGRIQAEFVTPFLRRVLFLLRRQGRIDLPTIGNRVIKVQPKSPLSRGQAFQEVADLDRFMELVAARFGPQLMNVFIKGEDAVPLIAQKMDIPERVIRPKSEQAQLIQQMAQIMGQQQSGNEQNPPDQGQPPPGPA